MFKHLFSSRCATNSSLFSKCSRTEGNFVVMENGDETLDNLYYIELDFCNFQSI